MSNPVIACQFIGKRDQRCNTKMSMVVLTLISGVLFSTPSAKASIQHQTVFTQALDNHGQNNVANIIEIKSGSSEHAVNIAPQPLPSALKQLHKQTGMNFVYSSNLLKDVQSNSVKGKMSAEAALELLLSGTSVNAKLVGTGTASLQVAQSGEIVLDGITVYGEKVERDYLETFTSVGVVTAEDLDDYSVQDTNEIFNRLANVRQLDANGGNETFSIRGLNGDGLSTEVGNPVPLVSVILDGALQNSEGSRRGARSTWDMKQIEVLRGPQSSLYGRAVLAGALVLESNDPTYDWQVALKGDYGSFEHKTGAFMVSGPIIDNQVAFRISVEGHESQNDINYQDNNGEVLGEDKFHNIRGKILVEPKAIAGLRVLFTFNQAFDKPSVNRVSGPDYFERNETGAADFEEIREINVDNYIANISYDFNEAYTFRSISAFTNTDLDIENAPNSIIFNRQDVRAGEDYTQDFRLEINDKKGSGLTGVIGAYYGDFEQNIDQDWQVDFTYAGCTIGGGTASQCLNFAANDMVDPIFADLNVGTSGFNIETKALYADLRYNVFGPLSIIGGLRYQQDEVRSYGISNGLLTGFIPVSYDVNAKFDVLLPKYGLSYEIDPNQTLAGTASRGYRQGFTEISNGVQNDVDPEFAWTYELAYRYVSSNKALSFGANLFYNEYKDQQVVTLDPSSFQQTTLNAGESKSFGAEIDGRYDFGNGFKVYGSLGLLKTEIEDLRDPRTAANGGACVQSGGNCAGNEFPEAPQLTFAFGGIYRHDNGLFAAADVSYTSSFYTGGHLDSNATYEVDSHFIANAKVGYQTKKLQASFYVKNLFDEEYLTSINPNSLSASVGAGRTFGAEIRTKF